jgi:hypothetical protein
MVAHPQGGDRRGEVTALPDAESWASYCSRREARGNIVVTLGVALIAFAVRWMMQSGARV